jgi:hypothetical protein
MRYFEPKLISKPKALFLFFHFLILYWRGVLYQLIPQTEVLASEKVNFF